LSSIVDESPSLSVQNEWIWEARIYSGCEAPKEDNSPRCE